MTDRPSLAELRNRVHKAHHREIGNWMARKIARPSAVYGTWLAIRLGLSAHAVTLASLVSGVAAAAAIGSGSRSGFILGAIALHLSFWLDHVDGQVARWRGTASLDGVYLDYLMHHLLTLALGFGLGFGLSARSGDLRWSGLGFLIASAWTVLALHNDCRYKAFFQRLKRETGSFRVDGGSAYRPSPPTPWPRRGLGLFTWPAYKSCEPHVVLLAVTGLAVAAIASPRLWWIAWRAGVLLMAILAPPLAAARVARAVSKGAVETEFGIWFRDRESSRRDDRGDPLSDRIDPMFSPNHHR